MKPRSLGAHAAGLPFDTPEGAPAFDGETYNPARDHERLGAQALRVWGLMIDGQWRTLAEIERATGDPQASVSARLRDFRKARFGGHIISRRVRSESLTSGTHEYRLTVTLVADSEK